MRGGAGRPLAFPAPLPDVGLFETSAHAQTADASRTWAFETSAHAQTPATAATLQATDRNRWRHLAARRRQRSHGATTTLLRWATPRRYNALLHCTAGAAALSFGSGQKLSAVWSRSQAGEGHTEADSATVGLGSRVFWQRCSEALAGSTRMYRPLRRSRFLFNISRRRGQPTYLNLRSLKLHILFGLLGDLRS